MPRYSKGESQATSLLAQIGARMPALQEEIFAKTYRRTLLFGELQTECLPLAVGSIGKLI